MLAIPRLARFFLRSTLKGKTKKSVFVTVRGSSPYKGTTLAKKLRQPRALGCRRVLSTACTRLYFGVRGCLNYFGQASIILSSMAACALMFDNIHTSAFCTWSQSQSLSKGQAVASCQPQANVLPDRCVCARTCVHACVCFCLCECHNEENMTDEW